MAKIDKLLGLVAKREASDLHLQSGCRPRFRIDGLLEEFTEDPVLDANDLSAQVTEIMGPEDRARIIGLDEVDFSYGCDGTGRFRCNFYYDYCGPAAAMRLIPARIPTLRELNMPERLESFAHLHSGLVLVAGPTGCGKSSTLAALVNIINTNFRKHIITLEDPIEYMHTSNKSLIRQRALYRDFTDFRTGIAAALREDPDVLLVGELRDLESIRLALTAAETGMLVFCTLHTAGAAQSIDRIYDVYPENEQSEVRTLLSQAIEGVISQVLLKRIDITGRIPATEVLIATPAVRNLIREGRTNEIANSLRTGRSHGMHSFSDSLEALVLEKKVDLAEAMTYAGARDRLEKTLVGRA
ncbi:MAG: type IV pilus twitching motility protein PilT [Planctomycetota bacterium]